MKTSDGLKLTEGGLVPPGHGWQCSACRHNWFCRGYAGNRSLSGVL